MNPTRQLILIFLLAQSAASKWVIDPDFVSFHNQTQFRVAQEQTAKCNEIFHTNYTLVASTQGSWTAYVMLEESLPDAKTQKFIECVDPNLNLPIGFETRTSDYVYEEGYRELNEGPEAIGEVLWVETNLKWEQVNPEEEYFELLEY